MLALPRFNPVVIQDFGLFSRRLKPAETHPPKQILKDEVQQETQRRNHFSSNSIQKRKLMASPLSKELKEKHNVRSLPIRKDDEVAVVSGHLKGREGKVVAVYRKKWVIHVERIVRDKANGQTVQIGVDPSNVQITKLKIDKDRKELIEKKSAGRNATKGLGKGKVTSAESSTAPAAIPGFEPGFQGSEPRVLTATLYGLGVFRSFTSWVVHNGWYYHMDCMEYLLDAIICTVDILLAAGMMHTSSTLPHCTCVNRW
ncbi:hypothetical protein PROFUN_14136 [Planoprotostelium fungivorum]|uniref:KOW domain-containing protein n=1 Tax=Planoprotostelium fungivorum TaxID=1890364 RepID=A0A2P6N1J5_9EUKA|nr:hypothetical protein PROFUN_14136 [Planoprotostelium fungivorum]